MEFGGGLRQSDIIITSFGSGVVYMLSKLWKDFGTLILKIENFAIV